VTFKAQGFKSRVSMRSLAFLFAVGASAQTTFTTITFTEYNDRNCQSLNTTTTRPVNTCIKEDRADHWRRLE